ncbi:MAG TPA: GMC family oxidoreductase N-terminal domain-containing protein [Caulobacteraceae bacterium]|jgi:choline dehydrogenase
MPRDGAAFAQADYVIVGAGSAGTVLANRLSEDPNTSVILLEAGGKADSFMVQLPVGFLTLLLKKEYDWSYPAESDPTLGGRSWVWSAGRMLGGGSSINGQVYIRGVRQDFDEWAAAGATGWGFQDVFPYFLRSEHWEGPPSQAHGASGPLTVTQIRDPHPLCFAFLDGCEEIGLPRLPEYNDGADHGAFLSQTNQRDGWRCSTEKAFLRPIRNRPNLQVITDAEVETVQFDGARASAVQARVAGQSQTVSAAREVVVCAGAMGSPALLMRSGIGPADALAKRGIAVVADSAGVGENLQEHSASATSRFVNRPTLNNETAPLDMARHFARFFWNRKGPLGAPAVQAMAFASTRDDLKRPDVQLHFMPLVYAAVGVGDSMPVRMGMPVCSAVTVSVSLCKPKGRGQVVLDDQLRAKVRHQALREPDDVRTLIAGLRLVDRLFDAPALASIVTGRMSPAKPLETDQAWTDYLRENLNTTWHAVGTCRMGSDEAAVVDPQLRVRGVQGLRVVDASVMPTPTSGNTNAASIMIGEKAAEMIRSR